ncbi:MAG: response regulator transcription factor [Lachnospiraceae bacterium]
MYRILIVEDDNNIADSIEHQLSKWGWEVKAVKDFQNVMAVFSEYEPQLVLLDIMLPFFNGYHWCTQIRKESKVPILFLSSVADNMNIVMAMNMGGDDFIVKPFDIQVLTAKIQAILRRTYDFSGQANLIEHQGAVLNLNRHSLTFQGEKIDLTKNEFGILQQLMEKKGTIVSREVIMAALWESDSFIDENTLTVNMNRLRKKLEGAGLKEFILTKKGIGYMIGSSSGGNR